MTAWRDQLQPASFRGVAFKVSSHSGEFGRRVELHEYPLRDKPYAEDLGRKGWGYQIEAYVIGADYISQRNALVDALEQFGPGTLVHPYFGQIRVQVSQVKLTESNREGGMAKLSITCVEAGELPLPVGSIDTKQMVSAKADLAIITLQNKFEQTYSTQGFPGWLADKAQSVVAEIETQLGKLGVIDAALSQYTNLPSMLAGNAIGLVASLSSVTQFRHLFSFGDALQSVSTMTPSRIKQAENQQAVVDLVRNVALVEAARQASFNTYGSEQHAVAIRDELADALETQMLTADDDSYIALQDVRAAMVNDMTVRAANLKRIRSYTPKSTLPALVIAHTLYQDALNDEQIIKRNAVSHPGFITGGYPLEVLNA